MLSKPSPGSPEFDDDFIEDDDILENIDFEKLRNMLPPGMDPQGVINAIMKDGLNAFMMTDQSIRLICTAKAWDKANKLLDSNKAQPLSFDGDNIYGTVRDGMECLPSFSFDTTWIRCNCGQIKANKPCAHVVALELLWLEDFMSFIPHAPTEALMTTLEKSGFGKFVCQVTGAKTLALAMQKMSEALDGGTPAEGAPAQLPSPNAARPANSGTARWPVATALPTISLNLTTTLEAEFNTTQLRELARTIGVKLKGTSKSGFTQQVADAIAARVEQMRANPDILLQGLSDDMVMFVRRAFTARDASLPLPRNIAMALWSQHSNREANVQFNTVMDTLRRHALLFPSRVYYGGRDVNYQWLPLEAANGNLPVMNWPAVKLSAQSQPRRSTAPTLNFLDAFDLFINAALSTGAEVRASLPTHSLTNSTTWLRNWEHDTDEAERLFKSRPGWVPSATSGISVPLLAPLTDAALSRLENQTGLPAEQCEFLFSIAAALQLIEAPDPQRESEMQSGAFKPLPTTWHVDTRAKAIEEWLALPDSTRFMRAWNAWLSSGFFIPEVRRASQRMGFQVMRAIGAKEFKPANLASEFCALRRFTTRMLRGAPVGEWIAWSALRSQIFNLHPTCAWSQSDLDTYWFTQKERNTKLEAQRAEDWQRSVGACIENFISDSLRWFGVLETDADAKGLQSLRLTPLRDWIQAAAARGALNDLPALPAAAAPRPRQVEPVAWTSDTQWRLPPAPDRAEFIAFARKIAQPAAAPFTYALSPTSIERALAQGITVDMVMSMFESFGAPLPAATRSLYLSIAERFGRVRIYPALTLLQLADDYALRELLTSTTLAQHIVYQISPRAVVIHADALDALKREMVARGYTPGEK